MVWHSVYVFVDISRMPSRSIIFNFTFCSYIYIHFFSGYLISGTRSMTAAHQTKSGPLPPLRASRGHWPAAAAAPRCPGCPCPSTTRSSSTFWFTRWSSWAGWWPTGCRRPLAVATMNRWRCIRIPLAVSTVDRWTYRRSFAVATMNRCCCRRPFQWPPWMDGAVGDLFVGKLHFQLWQRLWQFVFLWKTKII